MHTYSILILLYNVYNTRVLCNLIIKFNISEYSTKSLNRTWPLCLPQKSPMTYSRFFFFDIHYNFIFICYWIDFCLPELDLRVFSNLFHNFKPLFLGRYQANLGNLVAEKRGHKPVGVRQFRQSYARSTIIFSANALWLVWRWC